MRQVTRKGLITIAAAGGVLAMTGGYAHADAEARGAAIGSSGVASGNTVQVPVDGPVNVCGNTVTAGGGLNPAFGNGCANLGSRHGGKPGSAHGRARAGGAYAEGVSERSPGVGSGNTVQVPVNAPVNVCGNTVNVVGVGNSASDNGCVNEEAGDRPGKPAPEKPRPEKPKPEEPKHPQKPAPHKPEPGKPAPEKPGDEGREHGPRTEAPHRNAPKPHAGELAQTGGPELGAILPAAAGMLLGGALLYRRARAAQH